MASAYLVLFAAPKGTLILVDEFANQTTVHPIGLVAMGVLGLATLVLPRRYAVIPLLVMACAIPTAQRIVVLDLDWTYLRLLVLAGWIRMFARGDLKKLVWIPLDSCVVALAVVTLLVVTVRTGSATYFVRFTGVAFDEVGMYVLFRAWIRSWADIQLLVRSLIVISVPVALAFFNESITSRNVFSIFGGVPEITGIRDGRLRCQGAYSHPILAGCFWASLLPLIVSQYWWGPHGRMWALVGSASTLMIVILTASSTPLVGLAATVVAGGFYFVRGRMRLVRWGLLAALVVLHVVMKAPVWHLISRIDIVGGSTGWHRFNLIDNAIRHAGEWVFLGTDSTAHWGHAMFDVTNEYLVRGFRGGFLALAIFIAIVSLAYRDIGRLWRRRPHQRALVIASWGLGAALFTHCVMFMAVSYYGQILIPWAMLLASIGSMSTRPSEVKRRTRPTPFDSSGAMGGSSSAELLGLTAGAAHNPLSQNVR